MTLHNKQRYSLAVSTDRVGVCAKNKQVTFMIIYDYGRLLVSAACAPSETARSLIAVHHKLSE